MQVELQCRFCRCHFPAPPDTPAGAALERMAEEGPWNALGDGETFEDVIFAAIAEGEPTFCPDCGMPVEVSEESLGRVTQELLARW